MNGAVWLLSKSLPTKHSARATRTDITETWRPISSPKRRSRLKRRRIVRKSRRSPKIKNQLKRRRVTNHRRILPKNPRVVRIRNCSAKNLSPLRRHKSRTKRTTAKSPPRLTRKRPLRGPRSRQLNPKLQTLLKNQHKIQNQQHQNLLRPLSNRRRRSRRVNTNLLRRRLARPISRAKVRALCQI